MSYEKGIIYFNPPPFFLLLAGTKFRCDEFCDERGLDKEKTIYVLNKKSFMDLDPAKCRIRHGPNFHANPLYRDSDWQSFYRKVMGINQPSEEWVKSEDRYVEVQKEKRKKERHSE